MKPRFCVTGDYQVAVRAPRSAEHCRECYRDVVLAGLDLLKCEVVGAAPVTDARTLTSIPPGGVVELDEAETNVAALVMAGVVKVLAPTKVKVEKG